MSWRRNPGKHISVLDYFDRLLISALLTKVWGMTLDQVFFLPSDDSGSQSCASREPLVLSFGLKSWILRRFRAFSRHRCNLFW